MRASKHRKECAKLHNFVCKYLFYRCSWNIKMEFEGKCVNIVFCLFYWQFVYRWCSARSKISKQLETNGLGRINKHCHFSQWKLVLVLCAHCMLVMINFSLNSFSEIVFATLFALSSILHIVVQIVSTRERVPRTHVRFVFNDTLHGCAWVQKTLDAHAFQVRFETKRETLPKSTSIGT